MTDGWTELLWLGKPVNGGPKFNYHV